MQRLGQIRPFPSWWKHETSSLSEIPCNRQFETNLSLKFQTPSRLNTQHALCPQHDNEGHVSPAKTRTTGHMLCCAIFRFVLYIPCLFTVVKITPSPGPSVVLCKRRGWGPFSMSVFLPDGWTRHQLAPRCHIPP